MAMTASAFGSQGASALRTTTATSAAKGRRKNASRLAPASRSRVHKREAEARARNPAIGTAIRRGAAVTSWPRSAR
jgi:hypothetical protein